MMTGRFATRQDLSLRRMGYRMLRAARLDGATFRELRDDPSTTAQSMFLAGIVGLCYGAGLGLFGYFNGDFSALGTFVVTLTGLVAGISIAFLWSWTTFLIVTRLFRRKIAYSQLARPFLFAWSPGLLFIFMVTPNPVISEISRAVGTVWIVVANVFAVKNAVGISIQQSMLTFIASIVSLIFFGALVLALIEFLLA